MGTGKFNAGCKTAMNQHPIWGWGGGGEESKNTPRDKDRPAGPLVEELELGLGLKLWTEKVKVSWKVRPTLITCISWEVGSIFSLLYCLFQDGSTLAATQRAYHPDEFCKSDTLKIGIL